MYELSDANKIWNRACFCSGPTQYAGDRALADLLTAHGLTMNGGVLHAVECLTGAQLAAATAAYRFFGLDLVAELLLDARRVFEMNVGLEDAESKLDSRYAELIPDDSLLEERFENHLRAMPSDFAPL